MTTTDSPKGPEPRPAENPLCWFEDGNIVLQAEGTLFRVYKGILRLRSGLFDDLFSLPLGPTEHMKTYDSCPLVVVQETAKEMELLISVMHDLTSVSSLQISATYLR